MVTRRKIIRRTSKAIEPDEIEEDVDTDVDGGEDLDVDEVDMQDEVDEDEPEEEDEPEPVKPSKKAAAKPAPKAAVKAAPAAKPSIKKTSKPVVEEDEAPVVKKTIAVKASSQTLIPDLLSALEIGKALQISRTGENTWTAKVVDATVTTSRKKMFGKEYWDTVLSEDFVNFTEEWKALTYDEKKKKATKLGAKWEAAEDEGIDTMRITAAVREVQGIEKYKPEYQDRTARAALRGGGNGKE